MTLSPTTFCRACSFAHAARVTTDASSSPDNGLGGSNVIPAQKEVHLSLWVSAKLHFQLPRATARRLGLPWVKDRIQDLLPPSHETKGSANNTKDSRAYQGWTYRALYGIHTMAPTRELLAVAQIWILNARQSLKAPTFSSSAIPRGSTHPMFEVSDPRNHSMQVPVC